MHRPNPLPRRRRYPPASLLLALGLWLAGCATPEPPPVPPPPAPAPAPAVPPPTPAPPAPAPRPVPPAPEKLAYATDVFFAPGSQTWSPEASARLDDLARRAASLNLEVVIAVGHADPTEAGAQALSQARAAAVTSYFAEQGIDTRRLYAEGKGAAAPVADNRTAAGRAKNRRVEIELVGTRAAGPRGPCPTDRMAKFPWPSPPQPSATDTISRALLLGTDYGGRESLGNAAARLEAAVRAAGYLNPKYLGAGCDGFALVLDMEHVRADGTRMPGDAGWAPPGQAAEVSLAAWIQRLFYAPPGRYRQIVFVVSDLRLARTTPPPDPDAFARIIQEAGRPLPERFDSQPLTENHVVRVLVYEFEKRSGGSDALVTPPPGRLGVVVHLRRAGLI